MDEPSRGHLPPWLRGVARVLIDGPRCCVQHLVRYASSPLTGRIASRTEFEALERARVRGTSAQTFLCWRRSGLLVLSVPILLAVGFTIRKTIKRSLALSRAPEDFQESMAGLAVIDADLAADLQTLGPELIEPVAKALIVMSIMAALLAVASLALMIAALRNWRDYGRSRRLLLSAWLVSLVRPLTLAVVPMRALLRLMPPPDTWSSYTGVDVDPQTAERLMAELETQVGVASGLYLILVMAPVVLTVFPAIVRSGLNAKRLLPQHPLPGWVVVVSPPMYIIAGTAFFAVVNQIAGDPMLLAGISLVMLAPLSFLVAARRIARPTDVEKVRGQVLGVVTVDVVATVVGYALIATWVTSAPLVAQSGLLEPFMLAQLGVEFATRFVLTTLVGTDLVIHVLLIIQKQIWRHLEGSADLHEEYEVRMRELGEIEHRDRRRLVGRTPSA